MDAMGYDKESGGGFGFQRMLDDLGFKNPEGVGSDSGPRGKDFPGPHNDYGYWD
jgi:hypothetical protein